MMIIIINNFVLVEIGLGLVGFFFFIHLLSDL